MSKEFGSTSDALVPSSGLRGIKVTPPGESDSWQGGGDVAVGVVRGSVSFVTSQRAKVLLMKSLYLIILKFFVLFCFLQFSIFYSVLIVLCFELFLSFFYILSLNVLF